MSLYPSAPDIFVDRTGADAIASSDPNNAYDAIENIENFLGASGQPQAKLATLINVFRNMFQPLPQCSWMDADTIAILPTSGVLFSTNNFVIKRNTAMLTCCLSLHLDTGSELASSWYDLYLVGDGANSLYTAKFVLQGSAPSGITYSKKINSFRNDGSSNLLKALQSNYDMLWDAPILVGSDASASSWSGAVSCTNAMPSISTEGLFGVSSGRGSAGVINMYLRPNGSAMSTNFSNGLGVYTDGNNIEGQLNCFTDSLQQIQHHGTVQSVKISVKGYSIKV